MCGIIGSFSTISSETLSKKLEIGIACLSHRGPDDQGQEMLAIDNRTLILGHKRLSIIDLSDAGHQPMASKDERYTVVYNGEIYNYRELRDELINKGYCFTSDSDTEVLLNCWAEWGEECLTRFKGMFAFVIYDRQEVSLTCVRDAFGIKPLFYSYQNGDFAFASEVGALIHLIEEKTTFNYQMIYDYLVYGGYDNQQATFYNEINHLLPGHLMTINLKNNEIISQKRWWSPSIASTNNLSFKESTQKLRQMFLDNVKLHLRSDVPVGAALSGGLDSSAVVCAMRYLEPDMPIHTFTYVAENSDVNEEAWADIVNKQINAISHKIHVNPSDLGKDLDEMISFQGEPFVSTSIYAQYSIFRAAKDNGIVVTLDGQGADEVLAGYDGFPESRFKSLVQEGKIFNGIRFLKNWLNWPGRNRSVIIKSFIKPFVPRFIHHLFTARTISKQTPGWIKPKEALKMKVSVNNIVKDPYFPNEGIRGRELMKTLRGLLTGNGLNSLLRHADRNAMRWSIESRVPFLTIDLAEFLLSLPESYLISEDGETKHIFRAAMRGIVPDEILDRKDKIGFATPELTLLRNQRKEIFNWILPAKDIPFIEYSEFVIDLEATMDGKLAYNSRIWRMINLCRWLKIQGNHHSSHNN